MPTDAIIQAGRRRNAFGRAVLAVATLAMLALLPLLPVPSFRTSPDTLQPPGPSHWLGTNALGQDVFAGLIRATPNTIFIAVTAAAATQLVALCLALLAATGGRIWNAIVLRLVDILQAVPQILVLLLLATWFRPDTGGLVALLAFTGWHDDVRVLRALLLREARRENVRYARVLGAGWPYCTIRHIVPALWPSLSGLYLQNLRHAVLRTAGLGLLGLSDPRLLTWGSLLKDALPHLYSDAWLWLLLPPAFCLCGFLLLCLAILRRLDRRAGTADR